MSFKKLLLAGLVSVLTVSLMGCGSSKEASSSDKVIIYANSDEEPSEIIRKTLDANGFKDKYILQNMGTSELGGKLMAEGKDIEADMVVMSSFYLESAQEKNKMFVDYDPGVKPLNPESKFAYPLIVPQGAIFYNTEALKAKNLPVPKSIKDLPDPKYKDMISVSDINHSSTAWLILQSLIGKYGEDEAEKILSGIYANAGAHIESSGSGPLKKVRAGEVPIGMGVRHQAVADKAAGKPIDYVDPEEGTYSLIESVSIVDKGNKEKEAEAEKMAGVILKDARKEIIDIYPAELYEGEQAKPEFRAKDEKTFPEKMTLDLLKKHQALSEKAKQK